MTNYLTIYKLKHQNPIG